MARRLIGAGEYDRAGEALARWLAQAQIPRRRGFSQRRAVAYLKRHPEDVEVWLGLGQIAAEDGRETAAIQILDRAITLAADDWRPLFFRGKIESRAGRFAQPLDFLDKAASLDLVEPEIQYQRSLILKPPAFSRFALAVDMSGIRALIETSYSLGNAPSSLPCVERVACGLAHEVTAARHVDRLIIGWKPDDLS